MPDTITRRADRYPAPIVPIMGPMIHATRLTKRYEGRTVVDAVSLDVAERQIFGLLGPNAAGKTTIIRMLCGIIRPDGGSVRINGMEIAAARSGFGYVAQYFGQYEELSVWENLKFYASMYRVADERRLNGLLERYQLGPFRDRKAGALSGGFQRRLALVCALVHDPDVLFLDEPTAGIDPVTRKLLWDDFYGLMDEGKTLFVTTHYMEEAQRCQQLMFLFAGRTVASGTPAGIKQALGDAVMYSTPMMFRPGVHAALHALPGVVLVNQFGNELRIAAMPPLERNELEAVISGVTGESCRLLETGPNLEDVFIAITQEEAGR